MPVVSPTPEQGGALLVSAANVAGRGAGTLRPVAAGASRRVGAIAGGVAVTAMWAAVHGWYNLRKLRKGKISRKQAVQRTTAESVGLGLATGVGIAVRNVARASALTATWTVLAPFLIGAAVAGGAKVAWERQVAKPLRGHGDDAPAESGATELSESSPEPAGSPDLSADNPS